MNPEQIRELRQCLGLTQRQFAIELRKTKRHVAALERGERKPTGPDLKHLQALEAGRPLGDRARYELQPEKHRRYPIAPQRIKEFRERMGWTREELRRRLEIRSKVRIWKWEHGDSAPRGVYLERLLNLIKKNEKLSEFYPGNGE